jgi:UDP-N-acetylmuramoylalanine--D-glutamate ligase
MQYDLSEFTDKDVVYVGSGAEQESFKTFLGSQTTLHSYQSIVINDENQETYFKQLESLDPESSIVVKGPVFPGRLLPVSFTTPTKVLLKCIKQLGAYSIGVTGTKGKSTTASLIYRMLQQGGKESVFSGEDGAVKFDILEHASERTIFVLELSSFELAELDVSPNMAVITNLNRDHIDYHGSLENYWEAKRNIVRYMDSENTVVFNPKTEIVFHWLAETGAKQLQIDPEEQVDMSKSQLFGEHNRHNYLLAKTAVQELGVDLFSCKHILKNFKPLSHRLEKVRTVKGVTFIDDSIAYEPESAVAAIQACIREIAPVGCVMIGGKIMDTDFSELAKLLSTLLIPKLVLFPESGVKLKELFPESYEPEIFETSDMHNAVFWAAEHCPSGSVCLLSTASPSEPLWKNYAEKGELFQKSVLAIPS